MEIKTKTYLISNVEQTWTEKTILGNKENNDYPALIFYNNLSKDLGEYAFIKNLIIPEYEIAEYCPEILKYKKLKFRSRVDFFSPNAALVIEIDGKQHEDSELTDKARDNILKEYQIETIRIKASSIKNRDDDYFAKISLIKKRLSRSFLVSEYKKHLDNKTYKQDTFINTLTAIGRIQILIFELIKSGKLALNRKEWKISINSDVICDLKWVEIAIDDIFEWMSPISVLYEEKITKPEIIINYSNGNNHPENYLAIDFKLFERIDEKQSNNISLRNYYVNKIRLDKTTLDYIDYNNPLSKNIENKIIKNPSLDLKRISLQKILYQMYGYKKFKEGQIFIIEKIFEQENTLGLLPTGGGKSLCFQLPSILKMGFCVVVCPIKALMNDHVDELENFGFKNRSVFINNEQSPEEREIVYEKISRGETHFIFVSRKISK